MTKLINSVVAALSSLASIAPSAHPARYPYGSEWDALRSDWQRIGGDMKAVVERENGKIKKDTARPAA